ncbi:MAG: selenocysteine-specific translation elongation factor [Planctomycetes bacterium]|nr:selenocysteine-specific translation elongation factor [Planctomycetota bacterium]
MQIQPIVIGTAGHIDHGKSTLVKTLTGIDPDRLKEEQERGMTIDLGFARFALPDGRKVGIVDVPGHERFVKNMVAGATGIDLVVLVVAADDGVMPQTREHVAILGLLGVKRGLVALTKIDMVEPGLVELATDDVRSALRGTFLEEAPILPLSSITKVGLDEFQRVLFKMAAETPPRSDTGIFRMPIQRVFSAHGFGTIVTGIPVSGHVQVGDVVEVLPKGLKSKVRGIHAYGESTDRARAGHSCALNLAEIDHHDVVRGNVAAAPGFFKPVSMVGAQLTALPVLDRGIENRMRIRLHTGTAEVVGEVVLLDQERIEPGQEGLVQLRLDEPVVCAPGDRYVLRLASPVITLGGGVIVEESKYRLKRFKSFVVDELSRAAQGLESPRESLEVVLSRAKPGLLTPDALAVEIKRSREETTRLLNDLKSNGKARALGVGRWIHAQKLADARERLAAELARWFQENPHREVVDVRDLRRVTGFEAEFLDALLRDEEGAGKLKIEPGGLVRPAARGASVDEKTEELARTVLAALEKAAWSPPTPVELAASLGLPAKPVQSVLELLADRGDVHFVNREFPLARARFDAARAAVVENCTKNGSLDIPTLRDRLQTTRKFLIPLLEHFDGLGVTTRLGANRVLKRK